MSESSEAANDQDLVETVERMVLAALPKRLSEKALAQMIGVRIADLHRAFLIVRGAAFYTALHAVRLDAAHRLLRDKPGLAPEAVAIQCGFGHYGVFHRNYRRRFGLEPGIRTSPPAPRRSPDFPSPQPAPFEP